MNKKFFINSIILSLIVFGGIFLFTYSVQAEVIQFGNRQIFVDFNELPFDLSNWAPGMSSSPKTIVITNNEDFDIDVYFKAEKVSGDDVLANVLTITIDNKSNHLSDLFNNNIALTPVNSGKSQNYNIAIDFDGEKAGNECQDKTINFNFIITAEEIGKGDGDIPPVIIPGGGGGGYVYAFTIAPESVRISKIGEDSVTITWTTSDFSTSRVIYDTISHPTLGNPPNYGYIFSTPEQDQDPKVTFHSVRIDGLTPGTTYFYRTVSRASPEEVSREHNFTTKGVAGAETEKEEGEEEEEEEGPAEGPGEWTEPGEEGIPEGEVGPMVEEEITEEKEEPIVMPGPEVISGFLPNLLADIGDIFKGLGITRYPNFPWWIILTFGAYPLLASILNQYRERKIKTKWLWVFSIVIILILFLIWLILKCLYIWIIAIAILIYLFVIDLLKRKQL